MNGEGALVEWKRETMPLQFPTYQRIMNVLRAEIKEGQFQPGKRFITQQEVCQRFGVSRITADRAINELVKDGLLYRRRGHGTYVSELGQESAQAGSGTAARASIACIMSYIHSGHSLALMKGVERKCRESDVTVLLFNSEESAATERANVQRARDAGVAGVIVYPVDSYQNVDTFDAIQRDSLPLVMVDRYYPMLPTDIIVPDNVDAGYQVTRRLLAKGHRHIGMLWSDTACTSVQERLIGYQRALQEAEVPIEPEISALRPYFFLPRPERLALLTQWKSLPDPPTAIIASNGRVLTCLVQDLMALNGELNANLVLANLDSADPDLIVPFAEVQTNLPSFAMGYEAAEHIIARLNAPNGLTPLHRIMPITLSTAAPLRVLRSVPVS